MPRPASSPTKSACLLLFLLLLPCPITPSLLTCWSSLIFSGFAIDNFDNYNRWFNNESIAQLIQTGVFKGADAIEEYSRFASTSSPLILARLTVDNYLVMKESDDTSATGECVLLVVTGSTSISNDEFGNQLVIADSAGYKVFYKPTSFFGLSISRVNVFYTDGFINTFFNAFSAQSTFEWLCSGMEQKCADTWNFNEFTSVNQCVQKIQTLPIAGDGADATGNSTACRVLHSVFAFINPFHCAHTSFFPQADPSNDVKCSTSSLVEVTTLFEQEELELFASRASDIGIGEEGYYVCDCASDGRFYNQLLASVLEFVQSVNPFPAIWLFGSIPRCMYCFLA